jgi:nitroimidazol reductase NimA-like FMN-containing flavoprotein (pyridoxamine 5'-phosphate oxidase superfamily)
MRKCACAQIRSTVAQGPVTLEGEDAHSAEGLKLRMMRANPQVCFEVEQVDSLDQWRSVIAWGTFEALHGPDAERGMQLLVQRFLPHEASETALLHRAEATSHHPTAVGTGHAVVFRINLAEKTGRFEATA